jgi:hypothetical protein
MRIAARLHPLSEDSLDLLDVGLLAGGFSIICRISSGEGVGFPSREDSSFTVTSKRSSTPSSP